MRSALYLVVALGGCASPSTVEEGNVRYVQEAGPLDCSDPQTAVMRVACDARSDVGTMKCADGEVLRDSLCEMGVEPDSFLDGILGLLPGEEDMCFGDDELSQLLCSLGLDLGDVVGILLDGAGAGNGLFGDAGVAWQPPMQDAAAPQDAGPQDADLQDADLQDADLQDAAMDDAAMDDAAMDDAAMDDAAMDDAAMDDAQVDAADAGEQDADLQDAG